MARILAFLFVISGAFVYMANADDTTPSMQSYWSEFRQTVSQNNYQKLSRLTRFPLAIHGDTDSVPVKNIQEKDFSEAIKKVLNQEQIDFIDGKESIKTLREVVLETKQLEKTHILGKGEYFRVGDLVFNLKDNRWALFQTYLSEE